MPYQDGYQRVDYVCPGCEAEVLETWQNINGGRWQRTIHDVKDCVKVLLRRVKRLEAVKEAGDGKG